jgi:hypothetical protein
MFTCKVPESDSGRRDLTTLKVSLREGRNRQVRANELMLFVRLFVCLFVCLFVLLA